MPEILTRSNQDRPATGIIHLGPGAFFRAFGAVYTTGAIQAHGGDWGIQAVSLRSPDIRDKLQPQGYAYTSVTMAPAGAQHEVIEVLNDILVAPEDPGAVLDAMADPAIRIVSLTVTEKGYCHQPSSGGLQADHPDIIHDLAHPDVPRSAPGFIVHALARRFAAGHAPFTVLSCDNLPDNGALIRQVVLDFAKIVDPDLARWIGTHGRFPATMVDRITPATTDADVAALTQAAGYIDDGCVLHEPFRQWVIEDDFVDNARPQWDADGAQLVQDVAAFEMMKLRCLNGAHSTLAYLGYLAGYETIAETVADPAFEALLDRLWHEEIIPTLRQPEGEDLHRYCRALKERFQNPAIRHRTWQIAMDGSQKLPQRLLGTTADNLHAGRSSQLLSLAVAGWMRYVGGVDEKGADIDVRDPLAAALQKAYVAGATAAEKVTNLLAISDVFDPVLANDRAFREPLIQNLSMLLNKGAGATIQHVISSK